MQGPHDPLLGVLQLMNTPVTIPGSMGHPDSYPCAVRFAQVPGAWTSTVVGADDAVLESYVASARRMEAEGCTGLISNCGFTARFQPRVASAVSIPVALSSLLLVPELARGLGSDQRVGIVTYDADRLQEVHFNGAGWSAETIPIAVVGIEGSESWRRMADPDTRLTRPMVEHDVLEATGRLLGEHPDVGALLLECSAFPLAGEVVARETGLPTVHFLTLAERLIAEQSTTAETHA